MNPSPLIYISTNALLIAAIAVWVVALAAVFFGWWLRFELRQADQRLRAEDDALRRHTWATQRYRNMRNTRAAARLYELETDRLLAIFSRARRASLLRRVFRLY